MKYFIILVLCLVLGGCYEEAKTPLVNETVKKNFGKPTDHAGALWINVEVLRPIHLSYFNFADRDDAIISYLKNISAYELFSGDKEIIARGNIDFLEVKE